MTGHSYIRYRFTKSKQRAYVAAMTTQLRTLIPAEELYRSDSASYTNDVAKLQMVRESPQVHLTITQADAQTWSATAWHDAGSQVCSASGGVGSPTGAIGQIDCPGPAPNAPLVRRRAHSGRRDRM